MLRIRLYLVTVVFVVAVLSPCTADAQDAGAEALERVRTALSQGDVEAMILHAGTRIDLTVFGTSELLSKSQARYVVRSFFAEYPPVRVEMVDSSSSNGHRFATAAYWFETGSDPLSVYMRLRRGEQRWELRELRIDRSAPR